MKGLTNEELTILRGKIKSFLDITWKDEDSESEVINMITSGTSFINKKAGIKLDYFIQPRKISDDDSIQELFEDMCHQGEELIKNRCFYFREKALEDFSENYQTELNDLFISGAILKSKVEE